jgi:hypothetical protein
VCLVDLLLGLPWFTTGLTRAFHAISWGQLRTALGYHPPSVLLYGLAIWHLVLACLRLLGWTRGLIRGSNPIPAMFSQIIAVLIAFWIPRLLAMVPGQ